MKKTIKEIIKTMDLKEKAAFLAGKDFWHVNGTKKLNLSDGMLTDGPHGLRKQAGATVDHMGLGASNPAICFPAGCATACSFDTELTEEIGNELGKLCQAEEVAVILGPAMNIKRSPLCGRNFEYFSEDPLLSSRMAAGEIKGVQSKNVGTSPKHFLANNQEYYRMTSNSVVDERTMREIYLSSFEHAVKDAKPWTMMCSYNRINGIFASENKTYLTDILRDEWGFDGYVMTDWGACDDPVDSLIAGLDLEMPGPSPDNIDHIIQAVKIGRIDEALVNQAVERILKISLRYEQNKMQETYDFEYGHAVARKASSESGVLLKNQDHVLPLMEDEKILFVGEYAKNPRYQGGGSSHINAYKIHSAWGEMKDSEYVSFAQGYTERPTSNEEDLRSEAVEMAKKFDKVVIFAGLPESHETEGIDRTHIDLPQNQNFLIKAIAEVSENVVVVLHNGSVVAMPWHAEVEGILEMYLGGEAVGQATIDLLYGKVNPSGKLAETMVLRIEDTPVYPYYGVEKEDVVYREGVFVGYRYYETMKRPVLYPFGHGLSYTTFAYETLQLDKKEMTDTDELTVTVKIKNTGDRAGKEVVQLYVAPAKASVARPIRELRAFTKIMLETQEETEVSFILDKRAFAYWDEGIHDWYVPEGEYQIQIGKSASEIILSSNVMVHSSIERKPVFTLNSAIGDIMANPKASAIMGQVMAAMMPGTAEEAAQQDEGGALTAEAMQATAASMPIRSFLSFSETVKREQLEQLIDTINQAVQG
ncbi:MAG: glycoside hydrolase family 3 C-terminal domain-containing protein [Lachnospiraceae bacterium]